MAENPIDLSKIFDFKDTDPLDQVIAKTQAFNAVLMQMEQSAQKSAQSVVASMQAIQKSVDSLEEEMNKADATTKKGQETIANGAATTAKAVSQNEEYKKSLSDLNATIKMLQEQIEKLSESNKKVPKDNETISGSLADMKAKLKEATDAYMHMGDSTDLSIKQKAIKNITDLNNQVRNGQAVLNDAKRATDAASGSYNDLANKVANATRQLKAMEGGVGSTSQEFKHLQEFVKSGNEKLKEFDSTIGNNQRKVGDYRGEIEKLASKFGETGEAGVGFFNALEKAATSGWGAVAAGVSLAIFSVKEFFNRTEEGALDQEVLLSNLEFRWAKFKDSLASGGKKIFEGVTSFTSAFDQVKDLQRIEELKQGMKDKPEFAEDYKKLIEEIEAKMKAEKNEHDQFMQLAFDKEELMKKEIDFNENLVKDRIESAKLMEQARHNQSGEYDEQILALSQVTKAIALKKETDKAELDIMKEKARINREYTLVVKGNSTETMKALSEQDKAITETEAGQINSLRRMENMQAKLTKELADKLKEQEEIMLKARQARNSIEQGRLESINDEQSRIKGILTDAEIMARNSRIGFTQKAEGNVDNAYKKSLEDAKKSTQQERERKEKEEEDAFHRRIQLAQASASALVQITNDQYAAQEQRQQAYMARLAETYQEDMSIAGTNTAAKIQLTEQYRVKELQAQKELVKIKQRQAEFDKVIAAFKIGLTIAEDIAEQNYVGAVIAGLELVAVEAKPLPQFYKGTDYAPEGLALVAEKGPEIGISPQGQVNIYKDPQITYLKEGSRILNAEVSEPILSKMDTRHMDLISHQLIDIGIRDLKNSQAVNREIIERLDRLNDTSKRNKPAHVNYAKIGALVYEFKAEEETYVKRTRALSMGSL